MYARASSTCLLYVAQQTSCKIYVCKNNKGVHAISKYLESKLLLDIFFKSLEILGQVDMIMVFLTCLQDIKSLRLC